MGYFYYIRHGETTGNRDNKICGTTDVELTDVGHQQAIEVGNKIKSMGIKADAILYSPLIRAKSTAKHISDITGIPMIEEKRLLEQAFGVWEGMPRDSLEFKAAKAEFVTRYGNGESMLHLAQRIYNLLDEIKESNKIYILVAHNGISRVVESYFNDMTNLEYSSFGIKNCEIKKYEF